MIVDPSESKGDIFRERIAVLESERVNFATKAELNALETKLIKRIEKRLDKSVNRLLKPFWAALAIVLASIAVMVIERFV